MPSLSTKTSPKARRKASPIVTKDYPAIARTYAEDVVAGRIVGGKYLILRCRQFLDELERDWEYTFDPVPATKACKFIECLPVPDGKVEQTVRLQPWQVFVVCNIFGWIDTRSGFRRFTQAHIWIAAGNGKSFLGSAIGLYLAFGEGARAAEVACAAASKKQAEIVFDTAKQMMQFRPDFAEFLGVETNAHSLVQERTGSKLEPRSSEAKTLAGMRPYCIIVDEMHVVDEAVYAMLTNRLAKRDQTLLLTISTAGYKLESVGYAVFEESRHVIDGLTDAPWVFAIIYQADSDTINDENEWAKAHPNLDVTVRRNILRSKALEAHNQSHFRAAFITEQLNRWVFAGDAWLDMEKWDACSDDTLALEQLKGGSCFVGVDLASVSDIASMAAVFPDQRDDGMHYTVFWWNFLPEKTIGRFASYQGWVHDGFLIETPGNATDYGFIRERIFQLCRDHDVRMVAIDEWNASHIAQELQQELGDDRVMTMSMATKNLNAPMKALEGAVLEGRLHHTEDPVVRWMVGNVQVKPDALGNIRPLKADDRNQKNDAALAAIIAMNQACTVEPAQETVFEFL
jgi:phage terminase large subunit-like protein